MHECIAVARHKQWCMHQWRTLSHGLAMAVAMAERLYLQYWG